ncbi:MAG: hypothetical protein V7643_2844, partial [Mycobacterium sp.]
MARYLVAAPWWDTGVEANAALRWVEFIVRTLLLFDGIGGSNDSLLHALRELQSRPENAAYFNMVFTVLDDALKYIGPDVCARSLPDGFPLRRLLNSASILPVDALRNSIIAGICVHVYQVCHLQPMRY